MHPTVHFCGWRSICLIPDKNGEREEKMTLLGIFSFREDTNVSTSLTKKRERERDEKTAYPSETTWDIQLKGKDDENRKNCLIRANITYAYLRAVVIARSNLMRMRIDTNFEMNGYSKNWQKENGGRRRSQYEFIQFTYCN